MYGRVLERRKPGRNVVRKVADDGRTLGRQDLLHLRIASLARRQVELAARLVKQAVDLGIGVVVLVPRAGAVEIWIELLVDGRATNPIADEEGLLFPDLGIEAVP